MRYIAFVAIALASVAVAGEARGQVTARGDTNARAALETAHRFHALLAAGDSAGAVALLAQDLTVVESGSIENRDHYLAYHLGADMEFAKGAASQREIVSVQRDGDVVWLVSSSTAAGAFRGRPVQSRGAELMVLSRIGDAWRIRAVHWSSQPRRAEK